MNPTVAFLAGFSLTVIFVALFTGSTLGVLATVIVAGIYLILYREPDA